MSLFKDIKACVLSGFSGFSKLSGEVITKNIRKQGGIVFNVLEIQNYSENLDCIIVPEQSDLSTILKNLRLDKLPNCKIVTPS
jgi:hypothetical protein